MHRVQARQGAGTAVDLAHLASGFSLTWPGSKLTSRIITAHRIRAFLLAMANLSRGTSRFQFQIDFPLVNVGASTPSSDWGSPFGFAQPDPQWQAGILG